MKLTKAGHGSSIEYTEIKNNQGNIITGEKIKIVLCLMLNICICIPIFMIFLLHYRVISLLYFHFIVFKNILSFIVHNFLKIRTYVYQCKDVYCKTSNIVTNWKLRIVCIVDLTI